MSAGAQAFDAAFMMHRAGRREESAALCWEIVRKDRSVVEAWALMARVESEACRHRNAVVYYGIALQLDPGRWNIWHDMAIDQMSARMFPESERSFKRSIELHDVAQSHYNYGNLLCSMMRVDEAVEQYRVALAMGFDDPQIHPNLGIALIAQGKWNDGFNINRGRFNAPGFPPPPRLNYPKWHGEPLADKTILLYVEQGMGDEIMSLRFAAAVPGAHIILAVRPPMFRLARSYSWAHDIILMYDPPPRQPDFMCALLDVPAFVGMKPPLRCGYLTAPDRGFRLAMPAGLNVGICWASGKRDLQPSVAETARQKSVSFHQLASAIARPGVNLFSLQQTHNEDLSDFNVRDPMGGVTDFADTAFIVDHLDLIVTVDTSIAHLAGALGKPVWNLVRFDALWPWGQETSATCWYDSMTLYRQSKPFDWADPLKRVADDFAVLLTERSRGDKPLAVA